MDYLNWLSAIQLKLTGNENIVATLEVGLLDGWIKSSRLLALIEFASNYALFVFNVLRRNNAVDLFVDTIIPINDEFKVNIEPDDGRDLSVSVANDKVKLLFDMKQNEKTNYFIAELFKVAELTNKKETEHIFDWLTKYNEEKDSHFFSLKNYETFEEKASDDQLLSPDFLITQNTMSKSSTPIAARESVVRYQMTLKENDYTNTQIIKVLVGTWNVNGQMPPFSLSEWLAVDPEPPDIYAIGFQELDLSKEAYLFNDSTREDEWLAAVINSLHPKAKYRKIVLVRLIGMMLIIFVKENHAAYIRDIATDTVGTGIMGKLGNKGGVAARFDIHNTSMCFVNAHLAAHVEEYERRNQDYHVICSRVSFSKFHPPKTIKDHDQVYWLGDLNYRITDVDVYRVKNLIDNGNYEAVLVYDQLLQNFKQKRVFVNYKEGPITFRPTYKYDTGTDNWDSSEKNRAPAWCDRILWKGDKITQLVYRSHPALKISDHKPVSALFDSQIGVIDTLKYRKIHEEVMKKLDKLENEFLPQVMVDSTEIVFDCVYFLQPQSKDLIIANTGQVPVQFEFIKKLEDVSYCKDWLHIEPYMGFIMPGDKADIKLEVYVDKRSASKLNTGKDDLYDILVLHLEGGKDIFITVTGKYQHSCFGSSLEALCYITVPIREISHEELKKLESGIYPKDNDTTPYSIPKEIWFLVDQLYRNAMQQENLFEQPGLHSELLQIRDWLDIGSPNEMPGSVHSVAEALLLILDSTPEPIIPFNLQDMCLNSSSNYIQCKQIIMQLPEHRRNVFSYICTFLQELLGNSSKNNLDVKTIATLFGSIFIRDPPQQRDRHQLQSRSRMNQHITDRKKSSFVYHFLVNDQSDLVISCI